MTTTVPAVPVLSDEVLTAYARELARKADRGRVLALKGDPHAPGRTQIVLPDGTQVNVARCVSALAVREQLLDRPADGLLIIITDRPKEDLGETLTAQFRHQRIEVVNTWHSVAALFDATGVSHELRQTGPLVADALLREVPPRGYPAAPAGVVTRDLAMRALTEQVIGVEPAAMTPLGLMQWTRDTQGRTRWRSEPAEIRGPIKAWIADTVGPVGALSLDIAASTSMVDAVTIGLAADVLWPATGSSPTAALAARTRAEQLMAGATPDPGTARQLADTARGFMLRLATTHDPSRSTYVQRAQELLADLGWPEGAELSLVLPAGYDHRLRQLAEALSRTDAETVEHRLADLLAHESAEGDRRKDTATALMAVRLYRWLQTTPPTMTTSLADAMSLMMNDDAWVDRALADVAAGSNDPVVAHSYAALCEQAQQRRQRHDLAFAAQLAAATTREAEAAGVEFIEDLVKATLRPLTRQQPLLLIVVDGMSASVATELADGAAALGWREVVPVDSGKRMTVLAALPTVTTFSRTSLFSGKLAAGTQVDEKRSFPGVGGGPIFHKDDLRAEPGQALPGALRRAVIGPDPMVAVVLNTVDDTLAKHDPDGTDWTVDAVQHLHALLDLAAMGDRAVVLTSDHGHVVERGSESRPVAGADNRWRTPDSGPVADDEVLVEGRRVLGGDGRVVLPAVEGLRYGRKSAGYHGGATPAEATVPVIVLTRDPDPLAAAGWQEATPQAPPWWNQRGAVSDAPPADAGRGPSRAPAPRQAETLFDDTPEAVPAPVVADTAAEEQLARAVVSSEVFTRQAARAGRAALPDATVARVLTVLLAGNGRAHRDTVATAAGVPAGRFPPTLAMLRRLLNVDGYDVVSMDPDGVTVVLDAPLMRTQFRVVGG